MIWHSNDAANVISFLGADTKTGLPSGVAEARLSEYGKNTVRVTKKASLKETVFKYAKNYSTILILLASVLSFVIYFIYDKSKLFFPIASLFVVAFYIFMNAFSYKRCEKVIENMRSKATPKATVLRDSIVKKIDSAELVPGDILLLESGDYIPADARLFETESFRCDEKFVTGETVGVMKDHTAVLDDIAYINNRINMVYSGSSVLSGKAKAIVTETGMNCEIGKQVSVLHEYDSSNVYVKEQLAVIGKIAGIIMLVSCLVVFFISLLTNFHNGQQFAVMLSEALINSAALLISVLPEGMPLVAGIAVSLSVLRLLGDGVIIKNFNVFNKLPDVSVICSDKTGILTTNNMNVVSVFDGNKEIKTDKIISDSPADILLKLAALCTNQTPDDVDSTMFNDPTELAILNLSTKISGEVSEDFWNKYPRVSKIPFSYESKAMTSVNIVDGVPIASTKGSSDYILPLCVNVNTETVEKQIKKYAKKGLRVIAVAYKQLNEIPSLLTEDELKSELHFMGLIALENKLENGIVSLIDESLASGIKTVMLTGDITDTASALARRLGIYKDGTLLADGIELNQNEEADILDNIRKYSVFARLFPQDKERIVDKYKSLGEVVAITGDGVKDAPALKNADIGIALENSGTDVARGAADILLGNTSYRSIINAITVSKQLLVSLKNAVVYLLSCNLGEYLTILLSLLLYKQFPVIAVELLLINLLTDSFPVFSIISDNVKNRKTLNSVKVYKKIFDSKSIITISIQAIIIAVVSLFAFNIGQKDSAEVSRTLTFLVLCLSQYFNMLTAKSDGFFFKIKHFMKSTVNIPLFISVVALALLTLSPLGNVIGLTALSFPLFLKGVILSAIPFISGETIKLGYTIYNRLKAK